MNSSKTMKNFTKENIEEIRQSISAHMNQDNWTFDQLDTHIAVVSLEEYKEVLLAELEAFLNKEATWQRCENARVETFSQCMGEYEDEEKTHEFTWFYISASGEVFPMHRHEQLGEEAKTKEWYFFFVPEERVTIKFCDEGEAHALINDSEGEMYVLSFKVIRE